VLGPVSGQVVELTDDVSVGAATAAASRIDILVNNAGITGGNATTWELDPVAWRRVIEVNPVAPYLTCRHVVSHMLQRGWGRIVNIASAAGKEGKPHASHSSARKAGLIALTRSVAKEVATKGILVNAMTSAVAKTAMFAQMRPAHIDYRLGKFSMGRLLEVQEIAAMVAWLSREDCSFSTGAVLDITGGRATY
jgi:3-oxoacyl-[acyl-carrier protein] reductase